jgi:hypothetical protein
MAILKVKNTQGEWQSIPAFKGEPGEPGKDGAIQYTAGDGIKIENNVISSTGGGSADLSNVLMKDNTTPFTPTGDYNPSTKKYVDDSIKTAITDALGGSY